MNIIPASQPAPISADLSSSGLFVGLVVYDTTTGTPVQLTGQPGQTNNVYPMSNIASSHSYLALFQGLPQHSYLFVISQYTDGTYVTPTGASQSQTAVCRYITPVFVQRLNIVVGCQQQPTQRPVGVAQNSDMNLLLSFQDEFGNPVDITAATGIELSILEADGVTVLTKTLGTSISLVDGVINQAIVTMHAADFGLLPTGDNDAVCELVINGSTFNFNLYAAITVNPGAA